MCSRVFSSQRSIGDDYVAGEVSSGRSRSGSLRQKIAGYADRGAERQAQLASIHAEVRTDVLTEVNAEAMASISSSVHSCSGVGQLCVQDKRTMSILVGSVKRSVCLHNVRSCAFMTWSSLPMKSPSSQQREASYASRIIIKVSSTVAACVRWITCSFKRITSWMECRYMAWSRASAS